MREDAFIETFTGKKLHLLDPQPEEICIEDIAHALSQQCRYTGHTKVFYSVAEHSYFVSLISQEKLAGLLHDASEAYLSDLSRPIKYTTAVGQPYFELEERIQRTIYKRFGLPPEIPKSVKIADKSLLFTEKEQFMAPMEWSPEEMSGTGGWDSTESVVLRLTLPAWQPKEAESQFLRRFKELTDATS